MSLAFGIFDHQERRPDVPLDRQYEERLQLIAEADRLGFWGYHLTEHHQTPLCVAPSQSLFLAAAAQRTSRIRLGALVYLLPMYHPVRLIEEICMLDNLTGGRLEVGVGKGISPLEHTFWGLEPGDARARFDETLEILVKGLTHDRLTHAGRFFRFDDLPMELAPKQRPYPPLWYAGNVETAARHGMSFVGPGTVARFPKIVARYRELWKEARASGSGLNPHVDDPRIGSVRHFFVADTDVEAERRGRQAWTAYHRNYVKRGHDEPALPSAPVQGARPPIGASLGGDYDLARHVEACVTGSPETVTAFVRRYEAESGSNYCVGAFHWGDMTHDEALRSLRLFAEAAHLGTVECE